ncbi:hypothetical protein EDD16DRAFT_1629145 [Pisolithus croceorrhizus]|nr:hypothetical protein EDD16DRAFT_1629145 [Pisolithus croceorrhizus]
MQAAGIDLQDESTYGPAVSRVSSRGIGILMDWIENQDDLAVAYHIWGKHLALHQPKAISLPANERFSLLLKALSIRLAGKCLVTTVIQCSDFYMVDEDGSRRDPGGVRDNDNHSTQAGILTPLCTIAYPQVWRREVVRIQTKQRFRSIRAPSTRGNRTISHFYPNTNIPLQLGQKKNIAIKFFSDLFALEYLKNYIGDLTFFTRLPLMMGTSPVGDVQSVGDAEGWFVTPYSSAD